MNGFYLYGCFFALVLLVGIGACTEESPKQNGADSEAVMGQLIFEEETFEKKIPSCASDSLRCATLKAQYPVAKGGGATVCKNMNDSIFYYLRESLSVLAVSREEILQSLDSIAEQFFTDYEELALLTSDYSSPWVVETVGKVLFQSPNVISVELANYSFTGEAHPNTYTTLLNFEAQTGKKIELDRVIKNQDRLEEIVEEKFRATHGIKKKEDLNEAGFFWDRDFYLPANFALVEEGLYLYYNAYEAASYVVGATEILVPKEELEGILDETLY